MVRLSDDYPGPPRWEGQDGQSAPGSKGPPN